MPNGISRSISSIAAKLHLSHRNKTQGTAPEAPSLIPRGLDSIMTPGESSSNPDILLTSALTPQQTQVINAVQAGNTSKVIDLLSKNIGDVGPNIRLIANGRRTLLQESVWLGHYSTSEALIERGADVELSDANGNTALLIAAESGRHEEANLLLKHGADPTKRNPGRMNAVMLSVVNGRTAVFRVLQQDPRVDLNDTYNKGQNLLMASALNGHSNIVEDLLEKNMDPNLKDDNLRTALFYAAKSGHAGITRHLLESNAESNIRAVDGHTPLIAASRYNLRVEIFLRLPSQTSQRCRALAAR